jgi:succinate dehydrogenase/fumarate reductase flavoprotein subunit
MFEARQTDLLVIGGGAAGIRAAIAAAERGRSVVLVSKGPLARTGITPVAGEGVEAAVNPGDSPALHYADTVTAGRGLADENLVRALADDSIARVHDLVSYGAKFKRKPDGTFATSLRPGQSHSRNLFIVGGGYGMAASLAKKLGEFPQIFLIEDAVVARLLIEDGCMVGAVYLDVRSGEIKVITAKATLVASGGYEELWPFTDTPPDTTGEVLAMVYYAGAQLVDLEMVLYYPGVVVHPPAARSWLVQYEYILNPDVLDGRVLNGRGETFVKGFPARDEFIHAIRKEVKAGTASPHGGFFVDLSQSRYPREVLTERLEEWLHQFSNLKEVGIDLRDHRLEMAPAAHYCLGGIRIDEYGRTNIAGMYAAGEVTGNVHGANRLSGNALSETQVFGVRAAEQACLHAERGAHSGADFTADVLNEQRTIEAWRAGRADGVRPIVLKEELQALMDRHVGLERDEAGLKQALEDIRSLRRDRLPKLRVSGGRRFCYEVQEAYEVRGMLDLAEIVILSALARKETRGHHFRTDYPERCSVPMHTAIRWTGDAHVLGEIPVSRIKA